MTVPFDPTDVLAAKRDGETLAPEQIAALVEAHSAGSVSDAQLAAFAMAVCCRGLDATETAALCDALVASGTRLRWHTDRPVADKHSTGGVGDKVSLVLAPLAAACGLAVPMLSGRGLAHTGGTLDKLEAIPGYRAVLGADELHAVLDSVGCFIAGAGDDLAPADRSLYALRDHTATVPSVALIAASIVSKKIAGGATSLVVDTKWGTGAFCSTETDAEALAAAMHDLAHRAGISFAAVLTETNRPLGNTAGNGCEVQEAIDVLRGGGPTVLADMCIDQVTHLLSLAELPARRSVVEGVLGSGAAYETFCRLVTAQGGDLASFSDTPAHTVTLTAPGTGHLVLDALDAGRCAHLAGAARSVPTGTVDAHAGLRWYDGELSATERAVEVFGSDPARVDAAAEFLAPRLSITDTEPAAPATRWWAP